MVKLFKFGKKKKEKITKRDRQILEQYNQGRILQVDGQTDNKAYFKSLGERDGTEESTE